MNPKLTIGDKSRHADFDTSRAAFEAMIGAAAVGYPGISFKAFEIRPYRGSSAIRAIASFAGGSDRDTVTDLSDDLFGLIAQGVPGSWRFADRIEIDPTSHGFDLTVGFEADAQGV